MGEAATVKRVRIESVDVVRGAIMIIMALDHVREYFSNPGFRPTELTQTKVVLSYAMDNSLLRTVFFLLTGIGAYLCCESDCQGNYPGSC